MTAHIYGPWPAGSAGTVNVLASSVVTASDFTTAHIYKGRLYYTVIKA
jgi:hypothetical protein